jgi:hypothetical protein
MVACRVDSQPACCEASEKSARLSKKFSSSLVIQIAD